MQVLLSNISLTIFIFLSSYFFFYIPGKLINNKLLKNKNDFIISFILGFSIFTLISFFIYEIKLKVGYTIIIYFLYSLIIIFIFNYTINKKKKIRGHKVSKNLIYFIAIFAFLFLLFFIRPIYLEKDGSDMWYYLSIIRSFVNDGYFSNISPWFNTSQSSYPSNSFFLYLTIIKYLFPNISLFDIFRIVGIFLTSLTVLINTQVLNIFIKNIKYAFSIILFIFIISFILRDNLVNYMTTLPYYPKIFSSLIFIPTLIYIFLTGIYKIKLFPIFLTLIFIAYINQSSINIIISSILVFAFLILEIERNIFLKKVKNILIPLVAVILFGYFYLSGFYFEKTGVISTFSDDLSINANAEGPYFGQITEIFKGFYIYNPTKYFLGLSYYYLLIIILSIFSYKLILNQKILLYHYMMLMISFLIVFNPISIFILNKLLPINFLVRINWIFVGYIFLGYLIYKLIDKLEFKKYIYQFLLIFSTLCCLILSGYYYTKYDGDNLQNIKELEKYLQNIQVSNLVVTDKYTSNKVLALRKVKFLISHEAWLKYSTPEENFIKYYNIYDKDELFLTNNIFEYFVTINADYLLINKQITTNYKILSNNKNFKVMFENNYYLLIKI